MRLYMDEYIHVPTREEDALSKRLTKLRAIESTVEFHKDTLREPQAGLSMMICEHNIRRERDAVLTREVERMLNIDKYEVPSTEWGHCESPVDRHGGGQ